MAPDYELLQITPEEAKYILAAFAVTSSSLTTYLIARLKSDREKYRDKTARVVAVSEQARHDFVAVEDQGRRNQELQAELQLAKALIAHARAALRTPIILASPSQTAIETASLDRDGQEPQQDQQQLQYFCQSPQMQQQAA